MSIVGGLDVHRAQITYDYLDTETGEIEVGQVVPATRVELRRWLARFEDKDAVACERGDSSASTHRGRSEARRSTT